MLFNSFEFIFFFVAVVVIYFSLSMRYRVWFLLIASYYFYMRWQWEFIFLIFAQTVVNYEAGKRIGSTENEKIRKFWLIIALVFSFGLLFFFKYYNFFNDSFEALFHSAGLEYIVPHLNIILPVGISFYTFQTLSYTLDVYKRKHGVENSFSRFALYVAFFPQLVAGPIERATHLLDQFQRKNHFDIKRLNEGFKLILWGLFKKVVIADRLSIYVDRVYDQPELYSGPSLLLATYFFAFQIYCDFSAYSDIAIGSAKVLGYDIMQNFRLPYLARSISDFWKRWHISLTSWFSTYLYIPLGGSRVAYGRWVFNIFVVFIISGLWHGANWTFIIWGALHSAYYFLESGVRYFKYKFASYWIIPHGLETVIRIFVIFHLVLLGWVFFRANSLDDAMLILNKIIINNDGSLYLGASQLTTMLSIMFIGLLLSVQVLQEKGVFSLYFSPSRVPVGLRWSGYILLLIGISTLGLSSNAFIYFQF